MVFAGHYKSIKCGGEFNCLTVHEQDGYWYTYMEKISLGVPWVRKLLLDLNSEETNTDPVRTQNT